MADYVERHQYDPGLSWEENYRRLEVHHVEETEALVRRIVFERARSATLARAVEAVRAAAAPHGGNDRPLLERGTARIILAALDTALEKSDG